MENRDIVTEQAAPSRSLAGSYVDIPAVLGGAVIAAAFVGLFTTFGGALGLSTLSAEPGEGSISFWMILTAVWLLASIVLSFAMGGYVTGRLRRRVDQASADEVAARDGLNGLIVWGLGTLVAGWMLASAIGGAASVAGQAAGTVASAAGSAVGGAAQAVGSVAGGTLQAAGSAVGGAAQAVGSAVGGAAQAAGSDENEGMMTYITDSLLRPALDGASTSVQNPGSTFTPSRPSLDDAELSRQTGVVLGNVLRTGEISEEDKAFLIAATAQRTGLSQQEVSARVDATVQKVQETREEAARLAEEAKAEAERVMAEAKAEAERLAEEAKQAAIDAAETARKGAILTAFLLTAAAISAAAAALVGGVVGGRHRDEGRLFGGFRYN